MLYSPVPEELVFQELTWATANQKRLIHFNGIDVEVEVLEPGEFKVNRIISSNPQDFLLPELQPGVRLQVKW